MHIFQFICSNFAKLSNLWIQDFSFLGEEVLPCFCSSSSLSSFLIISVWAITCISTSESTFRFIRLISERKFSISRFFGESLLNKPNFFGESNWKRYFEFWMIIHFNKRNFQLTRHCALFRFPAWNDRRSRNYFEEVFVCICIRPKDNTINLTH